MIEGELKKQVAKILVEGDKNMPYDNSSSWYIDDIHKILDEAKKEFPMEWTETGRLRSKVKSDDDFNDIFLMTNWFKKWFGE
jgi:hypothetical protein